MTNPPASCQIITQKFNANQSESIFVLGSHTWSFSVLRHWFCLSTCPDIRLRWLRGPSCRICISHFPIMEHFWPDLKKFKTFLFTPKPLSKVSFLRAPRHWTQSPIRSLAAPFPHPFASTAEVASPMVLIHLCNMPYGSLSILGIRRQHLIVASARGHANFLKFQICRVHEWRWATAVIWRRPVPVLHWSVHCWCSKL